MSSNAVLECIHSLRSTHGNFSERDVPQEDLQAILDACVRAASASNMQTYSIVVLEDRAVIKEVCQYTGSKALVFCCDMNRIGDCARRLGFASEPQVMNPPDPTRVTDASLCAQTAVIAARALGIDSLITNSLQRGDTERVYRVLELPRTDIYPLIAVVLGYATVAPDHLRKHLAGPGVIHRGKYHRLTATETDALVADCDDPHYALEPKWREAGFAHYLEWFFTKWYKLPKAEGK